jgi:hypothetical protein
LAIRFACLNQGTSLYRRIAFEFRGDKSFIPRASAITPIEDPAEPVVEVSEANC